VVQCRAKTIPFNACRSYFAPKGNLESRPHQETGSLSIWWRRRVPPPGPLHLFRIAFITIVTRGDIIIIPEFLYLTRIFLKKCQGHLTKIIDLCERVLKGLKVMEYLKANKQRTVSEFNNIATRTCRHSSRYSSSQNIA
jgi:hypothetical protein